jgi:hypothetical protein
VGYQEQLALPLYDLGCYGIIEVHFTIRPHLLPFFVICLANVELAANSVDILQALASLKQPKANTAVKWV